MAALAAMVSVSRWYYGRTLFEDVEASNRKTSYRSLFAGGASLLGVFSEGTVCTY
tara:strand:+ start:373 stop:537 length:165 start_codon:yes stop_codon:yes gene_type:complete